ncbi:MAG: co-chaperone GroES [Chloroflexota bacterium]
MGKHNGNVNLQPLGWRVPVRPLEQESRTASGLILPETAMEKPQTGFVIAIGGEEEIKVKVSEKVLLAKHTGTEFKHDDMDCLLMESTDILARLTV